MSRTEPDADRSPKKNDAALPGSSDKRAGSQARPARHEHLTICTENPS
jgi:hypothetical protein